MILTILWAMPAFAQVAPPSSTQPHVRADGFIIVGGVPYFPLGIYHDSLDAGYYGQPFLDDLKTIADAGFNFVHVSIDFTADGDGPSTSTAAQAARLAQERGLHMAAAVYLKNLPMVVREQANWPAILMSSLGDDFNSDAKGSFKGPAKFPPATMADLNRQTHAIAPHVLTYSSGSSFPGAVLEGYEKTLDCIAIQIYPIGDGNESVRNELEAMQDRMANYWKLAGPKANKCLIVNLQAFSSDGTRWPTPQEIRLQPWVSVLGGARGLVWYTFLQKDHAPLPKSSAQTWAELLRLLPELKQVTGYFTDGKLTSFANPSDKNFDDGPGTWHAGLWVRQNQGLMVIVNTHRDQPLNIDLRINGWNKCDPLFDADRYERSMHLVGTHLKGTIAPASVQVYQLGK